MTQVADFSTKVDLNQVAKHFAGIIRYFSDYPPKNIDKGEFDLAIALGLTVTGVCQQGSQPALRGFAGGVHDATIANAQADAIGYDGVIYYVAEDPSRLPRSDWPTVEEYFRGVASVPGRSAGAYGGLALCEHLIAMGRAHWGWTVETWGGISGAVHLEQMVNSGDKFGLDIDVNNVLQADYGQHPRPTTGKVPPMPRAAVPGKIIHAWGGWSPDMKLMDIYMVSDDGNLYHSWWNVAASAWNGPETLNTGG